MTLDTKRIVIAVLGAAFLISLVFVQWIEVARRRVEAGLDPTPIAVPDTSRACVECHDSLNPGIIQHWKGSRHAQRGVGCVECHAADEGDPDAFRHQGTIVAGVVTPRDCGRCHPTEAEEFARSHHAQAGNILASLDNFLAETVEGARVPFDPHGTTPGREPAPVDGLASVAVGCWQCHGSAVALRRSDGGTVTAADLAPDAEGRPTQRARLDALVRDEQGRPMFDPRTWPNTGIGRLNLDGSLGSCSACHSRHDFSPRRARQPENCGKCHLGPDHPQKEIFEASKHGVAYRDLREQMDLDGETWVLGEDYAQAPTCATCHMSGNVRNGGKVTHDPGERISWNNRYPVSRVMDTDAEHRIVLETDPESRRALVVDTAMAKRTRMQDVCSTCHTSAYVAGFYEQYDSFVTLYNEKFAKPGQAIMDALLRNELVSPTQFDDSIEWTWFYLWHHEGRRARHGASMMAPDYAHWHGMYEVAERFYDALVPQARELVAGARARGEQAHADAVGVVLDEILARPEHRWVAGGK